MKAAIIISVTAALVAAVITAFRIQNNDAIGACIMGFMTAVNLGLVLFNLSRIKP